MAKINAENERERIEKMGKGGHLGGTHFGQERDAGVNAGTNDARPDKR